MKRWICVVAFGLAVLWAGRAAGVEVPPLSHQTLLALRHLPVQYNGRVKPFESFAREVLDLLTDSRAYGKADSVSTVFHMIAFPEQWEEEPILSVPYRPLREELGFAPDQHHISFQALFGTHFMTRLPAIVAKQDAGEKLTILENEIMDLYSRFVMVNALFSGDLRLVPSGPDPRSIWLPLTHLGPLPEKDRKKIQSSWQNALSAYREGRMEEVGNSLEAFQKTVSALHPSAIPPPWRLRLEVRYQHLQPLRLAWILYGVAAFMLAFSLGKKQSPLRRVALFVIAAGFLLHTGGIIVRMILAGRPPVSNFYESMVWLAWITVVLGLLFEWRQASAHVGFAAVLFSGITLLLSEHLPLDPAIQPIVAVLRSNMWLSIHVLTIVASYGALTLATGVAHLYAGAFLAGREGALTELGNVLYRVIQVGVILLAAGIMLGAVWANASWGRYWGWDPKETWALITLLWFLALLHAQKAGWMGKRGLAIGTILGFFLMLMTYYGVSFYLVGLHSYAGGHAKPLPPLLIGYAAAESCFLLAIWTRIALQKIIKSP